MPGQFCRLALLVLSLAAIWSAVAASAPAADFFFKDGDRIVVMGDSITEQHLYSNYLEMWTVSRFPTWNLAFRNVGIGGDRSTGGNGRFKRDVLPFKATAMTVDFGMNDGGYRPFDENGFKAYMGGLKGISEQAQAAGVRVAWVTPSPVEKAEQGPALEGYNETLEKYSAGVQDVAKSRGEMFVDQFHPFIEVIDKARAASPKNRIGGGDPVHPGAAGQAIMAAAILKGLNFPTQVSAVEIDAAGSKVVKAENCTATELKATDVSVSFQRKDAALPFFPAEAASILAWTPILEDLNQYSLKVSGLKSGKYEVRLGGKAVGQYTADELSKGVNLASAALAAGPVADQVKQAWSAVQAKNKYYHDAIFRGCVLASATIPDFLGIKLTAAEIEAKRQSAIEERLARMPPLEEAIRKALVIEPHQVEIVAAQ